MKFIEFKTFRFINKWPKEFVNHDKLSNLGSNQYFDQILIDWICQINSISPLNKYSLINKHFHAAMLKKYIKHLTKLNQDIANFAGFLDAFWVSTEAFFYNGLKYECSFLSLPDCPDNSEQTRIFSDLVEQSPEKNQNRCPNFAQVSVINIEQQ